MQVLDQYQTHTRYRFSSRTRNRKDTGSLVGPETHKNRFFGRTRNTQDTGSLVEPETQEIQVLL